MNKKTKGNILQDMILSSKCSERDTLQYLLDNPKIDKNYKAKGTSISILELAVAGTNGQSRTSIINKLLSLGADALRLNDGKFNAVQCSIRFGRPEAMKIFNHHHPKELAKHVSSGHAIQYCGTIRGLSYLATLFPNVNFVTDPEKYCDWLKSDIHQNPQEWEIFLKRNDMIKVLNSAS